MKFLIIFACVWATVCCLPANELKSRHIVVPAGKPEGRISNALDAHTGQFPYQVFLSRQSVNKTTSCGGTLISHTEILTAAHCTQNAIKLVVYLGSTNPNAYEVLYWVSFKDVVIHPRWNADTLENDISIIHIPNTRYSSNIQPAHLPTKDSATSTFVGKTAVVSGWGRTSASGATTLDLKYAKFQVISNSDCDQTFYNILPSQICATTFSRVTICKGDSGSALVLEASKTVIGIASFTVADGCEKNSPAVYTRVTSYLDWIEQNSNVSL